MTEKKAKRMATNYAVPQNRDDCDAMIRQLGETRRGIDRIEADMNDQLAAIKEQFEKAAEPLRERADALLSGIEHFCATYRSELTKGGKVKHHRFKNGDVNWRKRPSKVTLRGADSVIERLKELSLKRFIRTTEQVNKEAILADPDAVQSIKGISIGSEGEDFVVEPFEAELKSTQD